MGAIEPTPPGQGDRPTAHRPHRPDRPDAVGGVIEGVVVLGRDLEALRKAPFDGRIRGRSQLEALFLLAHSASEVTPGLLANELGMTAGAVTQLVDALRDAGLVVSTVNPQDARSRILRLTTVARNEIDVFERSFIGRLMPRFEALDDDELVMLASLLARLAEDPWTRPPSS